MNRAVRELLSKLEALKKQDGLKVLDVGGWYAPCRLATHMVDLMPFETINWAGGYGPESETTLNGENYIQKDLNDGKELPFPDKYFDFVVCRHTLEDIRDPIGAAKEIRRVAKAGYIETPHRIYESTRGVEKPGWVGHYHHRWLVEVEDNKIIFQFKPHNIHARRAYHFRRWPWQKVKEAFKNTFLLWEGSFEVEERLIIDYSDVKKDLAAYKQRHSDLPIFRYRWQRESSL